MSFAWFTFLAGIVLGVVVGYFIASARIESRFVTSMTSLQDEVTKLKEDLARLRETLVRSEEEKEKLARFNLLIPEIVRKFTTFIDPEDIPHLTVRSLKNFFNAGYVWFFLPEMNDTYLLVMGTGYSSDLNGAVRIRSGEGIVGLAIEHRKTLSLEDYTELERHTRVTISEFEKQGFRAELVAPLIGVDGVYGAVALGEIAFRAPEEKRYLSMIADIVALAYDKSRMLLKEHLKDIYDEVTGVFNKGYFAQRFSSEVRKAEDYILPLSLVLLDVDDLKSVNEKYGYEVGDRVLRHVAEVAKERTRRADFVSRYDGDRFFIVMISSSKEQAYIHASRIVHEIASRPVDLPGFKDEVRVTVSAAVVTYSQDGQHPSDLISKAEEALRKAKEMGGNRVVKA
ncbi:MAG: diguanylate cyclase [Deltaproteobacteria bacterium]|nr:MAG: diguanylate cyclase [Deltaproteobacteria bacterium]